MGRGGSGAAPGQAAGDDELRHEARGLLEQAIDDYPQDSKTPHYWLAKWADDAGDLAAVELHLRGFLKVGRWGGREFERLMQLLLASDEPSKRSEAKANLANYAADRAEAWPP
jgi:hypothetical protein